MSEKFKFIKVSNTAIRNDEIINDLKTAELSFSNESNITDEHLFENLLKLWQHLGHQPRRKDLTLDISEFSQSPYNRRFLMLCKILFIMQMVKI